ncbi:LysR family transcriptional regulator [Polyangium jinanense]|uniref:LysR family transcriptional regulator n=1 Tax=Polyangium jinanense TaxID=2829994 RepID=A0A9X4AXN0_9BACT|nr:LysR family transcriptional regulator [Polyangium jinanense]MDC3958968.1 LysR family transcriptional regulator [Polyangium jinanense]MDC3986407.1 LysR family transcriptional regulator [Polyangium jinanense]
MIAPALAGSLPSIEAFCRTYEAGSFTAAARALSVTPQATSRSVARLEHALGVTLFRRTTRSLAPTEHGRRYYALCVQALSLLAAGERDLASGRALVEGRVRISAPTTYGHHRLLPILGVFRDRYPGVRVEVNVTNRNVDFVRDGHDLAIRMGTIQDKTLVARKLGDFPLGVYASPSYLSRHGAPRSPEDLSEHACVAFLMPSSGRVLPWTFHPAPRNFVPDAPYTCSDDALGVIGLSRAGVGLVQMYDFLVEEDVARGSLVEVLTPFRGASRPFSLIHPRGTVLPPAARVLKEFVLSDARERQAPHVAR